MAMFGLYIELGLENQIKFIELQYFINVFVGSVSSFTSTKGHKSSQRKHIGPLRFITLIVLKCVNE